MLSIWLEEPEDIVSSVDPWSAERAKVRPRKTPAKTDKKNPKKEGP